MRGECDSVDRLFMLSTWRPIPLLAAHGVEDTQATTTHADTEQGTVRVELQRRDRSVNRQRPGIPEVVIPKYKDASGGITDRDRAGVPIDRDCGQHTREVVNSLRRT